MNIQNSGDNPQFTFIQTPISNFANLPPADLASQHAMARKAEKNEMKHRGLMGSILALVTLLCFAGAYLFFLNRGDLKIADIMNNFMSSLSIPLAGMVLLPIIGVLTSREAYDRFAKKTEVEIENKQRQIQADKAAKSRLFNLKEWRLLKSQAYQELRKK
ncbi:hypothetical protein M3C66_006585 [Micrococcus luteus]|nr:MULTISPECIES: hypothetical protein [Micrococcus]MBY0173873.1 hypothetical protein [Micrococcus luteus]MCD0181250.1 hypothetical protein [Micrococcus luteus]MCT2066100.1 hypothetical protein [Micrococcus luteus]MCV7525001.1 hypothetical protein [Micrococcus luteus]MCV7543063.1 hypothetical protein [Micrococcus luteus]